MSLVGVFAETIAADYAESQKRLWPLYEKLVAEASDEDRLGFWLKPTVTPETMLATLAHLDAKYGGVQQYLTAAGVSTTEMERLKNRL